MNEFGTTEIGLNSRTDSNKAINELELKCPKTMKDMLLRNIRMYPGIQRDLVTCGLNISGLHINQLVVDNPSGYVCRLSRLPTNLGPTSTNLPKSSSIPTSLVILLT
ncbi:hypothetical protein BDC45DRAFT_493143 [Circinella umbellata]|nr:hypothetical protein BDC45DRAFT_493143 [Circinella umbellata]